jgi:hypothetical protein
VKENVVVSPSARKWLLPLPRALTPPRSARGTLLVTSRTLMRDGGYFDKYSRNLSPSDRERLDAVVPASWISLDLAHAHFEAADLLELPEVVIVTLARGVSERLHQVFLATAFRLVREAGLTPWNGIPTFAKLWARLFDGGALGVEQLGPKDGRLYFAAQPLLRHRYFRIGLRTHVERVFSLCAQHVHMSEVRGSRPQDALDAMTLLARWV